MLKRCLSVLLLLLIFTQPGLAGDIPVLDDFVLYADSAIEIEKIADSTGNVGSNGQIEILKGRCGTLTGDLRAVDRIENKGNILISGNVLTAAGIDNFGTLTVNGQTDGAANLAHLELPALAFATAGSDLEVPRGGWQQLAPGTYGRVEVNKDAVLELSSGVYDIIELDTEKNAVVKINASAGAVTVNISGRLDIDQGVEIRIIEGSSRDVAFNFSGTKKVEVERKALFCGSLVAPQAKVEFGRRSRLEGRVIADVIVLKKGVSFKPHQNVSPSHALVADAGEDRTVKVGDKVILDGSASYTTLENPLTFQWSWVSHPAGSQASFSDPASNTPEWTPDLSGIYIAELIVGDTTGASATDNVTITVAPSQVDLDDFVLYADAEIRIDEIAGAIGYIGSNGKIEIEKGSAGTVTGDLWALGSIRNHAEIIVEGDVITNEQIHDKSHLTVTGTIFENVNLPAVGLPEPIVEFDRDAPDLNAVMGSPLNLVPGSYGRVRVDKGAVLQLAGGEYAIKELDVGDRALILIQGPVDIHLLKNLDIDDYAEWMITGSTPIQDVKIYLHGKKAEIDDYAVIRGTLIAPRAKVRFKKFSRLHGAVYARRIDLAEGVYIFHQDQSLPRPDTYYRSIGTHTGVLYGSGTATIAENSTRVSFEGGSLPENIGKGDRITLIPTEGDPEIRYVLNRDTGKQLTLQHPVTRTQTAVGYTIERAYNSIQSWEDDRQGDLVAENRYEVGICYKDGPFVGNGSGVLATIEGSNTDKDRFMHLTVAKNHRHFGTAGIGVILDGRDVDKFGIRVLDDYTKIEGLELKGFRSGAESAALEVKDARNVILEQLLIHDFKTSAFIAAGIRGSDRSDFTARNCIIFDGDAAGIETDGRGGTAVVQNCTIFGMQGRGVHEDKGTYLVQNTVAMANGLEDFKIKRGRQSNNLSSDNTADGQGSLTNMSAAKQFVSIDPAQPDLHLKDGADAYDKGFDLSMCFEADVDGGKRPDGLAWDIGADEFLVTPEIKGQEVLTTPEDTELTITLEDLIVIDLNNDYPADFKLTVLDGTNYSREGNTITPVPEFNGDLTVPVKVNDGVADSDVFNLSVTVTPVNDVPEIKAQKALSTSEEMELTITLDDLTVIDPDNAYPTDFTLFVLDGENYNRDANAITPVLDFYGVLIVPVKVNDGSADSDVFNLSVTVTPVNDVPEINAQEELTTAEETTLTITLDDLTVTDPDNAYPADFTLAVLDGTNYSHDGNSITPALNFNGTLTVPVKVNDGAADSDVFNLIVTVTAVNDAPEIESQLGLTTSEEIELTISLNDLTVTDPDNAYPVDFTLVVLDGENYSHSGNTITPALDFNGTLTVPVKVNDGVADSEIFNLSVAITPVNDVPEIKAQEELSTPEETELAITLNDLTVTDPDNTYPADFTLVLLDGENYSHDGNTITPAIDINGTLTVPVKVNDGAADSEVFNLSVTVIAVNDVPEIVGQVNLTRPEETELTISLDDLTVVDPDNAYPGDFTLLVLDGENYGREGNTITPTFDFNGTLTVPVKVNDGSADSEIFNLSVAVTPVNDDPEIKGQVDLTTPEETELTISLDDLTVTDPDNAYPADFTLVVLDGTNYNHDDNAITPAIDFNGRLTVPVKVNDGTDDSEVFNLSVAVIPVNDVPEIEDQASLTTPEETNLTIMLNDLTVTDPDNAYPVDFTLTALDGTSYNRVGNTIMPAIDFNGILTVPVKVNDGAADSDVFNLSVVVSPVNDVPEIEGQVDLTTPEETELTITLDDLTVVDPDNVYPENFALFVLDGMNYSRDGHTITPVPDFNGTLTVPIKVKDGAADSEIFNLSVAVSPVNDVPEIEDQKGLTTLEETELTITLTDLTVSDPDNVFPADFTLFVLDGENYSRNGNAITPAIEFNGVLTVSVKVNDGAADSDVFKLSVAVTPINDVPEIEGQVNLTTAEETELTITLDDLTVVDPDNVYPENFALFVLDGKNYAREENSITPASDFNGTLTVPVKVNDGVADSDVFNLSVEVTPVNDEPKIDGQEQLTTLEDTELKISLDDLTVTDPDNAYSADFTLFVLDGTNYSRDGNAITPTLDFNGVLTVPVKINDGRADSEIFNLSVSVTPVNDVPEITAQEVLNTPEETELTITLNDLTVADPDNSYPADFMLFVLDGTNYSHDGNTITPTPDFNGTLTVTAKVNDGIADSDVFYLSVVVTPINDVPEIEGQKGLTTLEETELTITLTDLTVSDPDNVYPADYTLFVLDGANYSRNGNTITPVIDFNGVLTVPLKVNDGVADSEVFNLSVAVTPVNDVPDIIAQEDLNTPEETRLTITFDDLTITDPDNDYPADFTLVVLDGENYSRDANAITPALDFNGVLTVPVKVNDGVADSDVFNLSVEVTPVNDVPEIKSQEDLITTEETALTITLDDLTVVDPDNIYPEDFTLFVLDGTNYSRDENTITPAPDFNGTLTIPVKVNDGSTNSDVFNLIVAVTPVNDVPEIESQVDLATPEETELTITLADLAVTDPDNDYPADFALSVLDGENYSRNGNAIMPTLDFNGTLTVPVKVKDGTADSEIFNLSVTVTQINDMPEIEGQKELTTPEEMGLAITLDDLTVTDPDNVYPEEFTLFVLDGENYSRDGNKITPAPDFNGTLTIPVKVNDGIADSEVFNLSVVVTPVNDVPEITAQEALTSPEEKELIITLDDLTVADPDNAYPANFTLTVLDGADYSRVGNTITPELDFNGTITVPVKVNDGEADSEVFNLSVAVTPVNDVPEIEGQVDLTTPEETQLKITFDNITVTDPDNAYPADFALFVLDGENYSRDGNSITPALDFNGTLTVPVKVKDGMADSEVFNLSVSVTPVNDVPEIKEQEELTTAEETELTITVNDLTVTDPDNDYPADFTLSVLDRENYSRNGNTIAPVPDFNGTLTVPVKVNDGIADSEVFNLSVEVTPVNDVPEIEDQVSLTTPEESKLTITLGDLTVTDPDNDYPADFTLIMLDGANYTRDGNAITPVLDFNGTLTVPVKVNDGLTDSDVFNLSVAVTPVNDVPEIEDQVGLSTPEETEITITLDDLTVTDPDNDYPTDFTIFVLDGENYSHNGNKITPALDFNGTLTVPVKVNDGAADSDLFNLSVEVTPVNDVPKIEAQVGLTTPEETTLTITLDDLTVTDPDNAYPADFTLVVLDGTNYNHDDNAITPAIDFNGRLTVPAKVNDGLADSDVFILSVAVTPINDVAEIEDQVDLSTPEETEITITLNDLTVTDPDNVYPAEFKLFVLDGESYSHNGNKVTPTIDFNGTLTVPVKVNDGAADSDFFNLSVEVTPVNDVPEINDQVGLTTPEETELIITLDDLTVIDPDNTYPTDFTLVVLDGANYTRDGNTITPALDFNGTLTVPVKVNEGMADSDVFNLSVSVTPVNDVPMIEDQVGLTTPEETELTITLTDLTVTDPDNTYPADFMLSVLEGENYGRNGNTITPALDFNGVLTVPVKVNDGVADSEVFNLSVTVTPVNDVPEIKDQVDLTTPEETNLTITLDDLTVTDPDNAYPADFTLSVLDGANYSWNGNTITPALDFNGVLTVPVKVKDGAADSGVFNLIVTVSPVNDVPEFKEQEELTTAEETALTITLDDLTVIDPDNAYPADFTLFVLEAENYGHEGHTITPAPDFNGVLTVPVKVNDGVADSEVFNLSVAVTPVNDVPDIEGQLDLTTPEETELTITLNDLTVTDPDNDYPAEFTLFVLDGTNYSHDENSITPSPDFNGTLTIPVKVNDGRADSDIFNLNVTVTPVNDVPMIEDQVSLTTPEETELTITLTDLTVTDPDHVYPADFTLFVLDGSNYSHDGNSITPVLDFNGMLRVPVKVNDGMANSEVFNLSVAVTPVNDVPEIKEHEELTTAEETTLTITLDDLTVADPDNDYPAEFTLSVLNGENYNRDGNMIAPALDFNGVLTVPVKVNDGVADSEVFNLSITVTPVNDVPEINDQVGLTTAEETELRITLDDLTVIDPDNIYPVDFTLIVLDGTNYSRDGNSITPAIDFNGTLTVPVRVNDGVADSDIFNLNVLVTPVNDVPEIEGQKVLSTPEEAELAITLNDLTVTDPDNDYPADFTLSVLDGENYSRDGNTITPALDFNGTLIVPVIVNDGVNNSDVFNFIVAVTPVNDAPEIEDQTDLTTPEETELAITLNDLTVTDPDNVFPADFTLSVLEGTNYSHDGNTITPAIDFNGTLTVPVKVNDGLADSDIFNLSVAVTPINDVPEIQDQVSLTTPEETELTITLNDLAVNDPDNAYPADFTFFVIDGTNYTRDGNTIAPVPDFNGVLTVPVKVNDGEADSDVYHLSVEVTPVNDVPKIEDQVDLTTAEETELAITLNDLTVIDPDNIYPADFTLSVLEGENYSRAGNTITPALDFNGVLTVRVKVNDGAADSDVFNLSVSVTSVNDVPEIRGQQVLSTSEETGLTITLDGLTVIDPDNSYPADFTLIVLDGENYSRDGNKITPEPDFNGTLTVPAKVNDGRDDSDVFNLSVSVTPINDVPNIEGQVNLTTAEETELTITLDDLTVFDPDNNYPTDFTLSVLDGENYSRDGNKITPTLDFNGTLTVPVKVNDGMADSEIFNLSVSVTPVNDVPEINDQVSLTTPEETALTITLEDLTVTDPDNDYPTAFTLSVLDGENYTRNGNTIRPMLDLNGTLTVPVKVNDGAADSDIFNLNVAVTPVNDVPKIEDQEVLTTPEETVLTIALNDLTVVDPDNVYPADYTLFVLDGANYSRDGNSITPALDFNGTLTIPVKVNDGSTDSDVFNLIVAVTPVNDLPEIKDQVDLTTAEETELTITLTDLTVTDPDNTYPADFTLFVLDGTNYSHEGKTITPAFDFNGTLTIPVKVNDGEADSDVFNLSVTVTPVNDVPEINAQEELSTPEETEITITLNDLTVTDPDNDYPTDFTIFVLNGANYTRDGNTITPEIDFNGTLTVPAKVNDGTADSDVFNLSITVTPVNDVPRIEGQKELTTPEEMGLAITLDDLTVTDPDNDYPADFTLVVLDGENYSRDSNTITPAPDFNGTLTIPVKVNDGAADSEVYNLSVTVTPINDLPEIYEQADLTTPEETELIITLTDLTVIDPDNDYPADFTLKVQDGINYSRGGNSITPAIDFNGMLTVPVKVNDGIADSEIFNLSVAVTPINDVPKIVDQVELSIPEETELTISLNDLTVTDPDNAYPADFTLVVLDGENYSRDGNTITPALDFNGALEIPVSVNDGFADSNTFYLSAVITAVNDAPTVEDFSLSGVEDNAIIYTTGDFSNVFFDVDGDTLNKIRVTGPAEHGTLNLNGEPVAMNDEIEASALNLLSFTPDENWYGTTAFSWNGFDGTEFAAVKAMAYITIAAVNDIPTVFPIADQTTHEDTPTETISLIIGDVETAVEDLTVSASSSNQTLVALDQILFGGDGASRTITIVPAADQSGSATITIGVSDGAEIAYQSFELYVAPVADQPGFNLQPTAEGYDGAAIALNIAPPFLTDTDGSEVMSDIKVSGVPAGATLSSGIKQTDGLWTLTSDQLQDLTVTPPLHGGNDFSLNLSVTSTETTGGSTATTTKTINVIVTVAANDIPVTNVDAVWEQGLARLSWDLSPDVKYEIYRGTSESDISALTETSASPYRDQTAKYYSSYYYRLATVKQYTVPVTGEIIQRTGPLSQIAALKGLPVPKVSIAGSELTPAGDFRLSVGRSGPYTVSGTYTDMSGEIEVMATSAGATGSGSGANGSFSVSLSSYGTWQISVSEKAGWKTVPLKLNLVVDDKAPDLKVNEPPQQAISDDFIAISGVATDTDSGLGSVVISSDRYAGSAFDAVADAAGKFTAEIPLKVGDNQLGVIAADKVGNQSRQDVNITVQPTALPLVIIHEPANGSTVNEPITTVAGEVRSSLPPEQIRLELKGQVVFPTGADAAYNFEFNSIRLAEGANTLVIQAVTPYGSIQAQTTVSFQAEEQAARQEPPALEINAQGPEIYVSEDHVVVRGTAGSETGIVRVTINGQIVELTGSTNFGAFESKLYFTDPDQDLITITVEATDENGQTSTATYIVRRDAAAPVIELTDSNLQFEGAVNDVAETPYILSGTVTDASLAGFNINAQNVGLLPAPAMENVYTFEAGISLARGNEVPVILTAWDHAGNQTSKKLILSLNSHLDIDIISPQDNAELMVDEATVDLNVTARVPGLADGDRVVAKIDGAGPIELDLSGQTATGVISLDDSEGEHALKVEVLSAADELLASRTNRFSIVDSRNIPLAVSRQEPQNNAADIEPNSFIAFYFNKSIDTDKLQIDVRETVHGKIYRSPAKGADITRQSVIELIDVDWDQTPISGGIAWFPGDTMAAFYPDRDFTYGGTEYVTVFYDGAELSRSILHVRPLPTLIQGFVAGQDLAPVEGIEIELPDLGRITVTDQYGKYGFGFGEPAQQTMPAGRYQAIVNPDLKNPAYGTVSIWVNVQAERLNSIGITPVPALDPKQPFRPIISGENAVSFAENRLILNPSDATLVFPDGQSHGVIHVQPMELGQLAYPALPSALPHAVFAVHPAGVEISGNLKLTFALAEIGGSLDYIDSVGERVVLVGLDPAALQLVPVGVGRIDRQNLQVISEGDVALKRLDCLGYAFVDSDAQTILQRYAENEIGLMEMIGELQSRF